MKAWCKSIQQKVKEAITYSRAKKAFDRQFPLLSLHLPYVSKDELEQLEKILNKQREEEWSTL